MPTIRERGGKFQAQVRIKQHGRIVHQESATFETKKQAQLWALSLERKLAREGIDAHRGDKLAVEEVITKQKALLTQLGRDLRPKDVLEKLKNAGIQGAQEAPAQPERP